MIFSPILTSPEYSAMIDFALIKPVDFAVYPLLLNKILI